MQRPPPITPWTITTKKVHTTKTKCCMFSAHKICFRDNDQFSEQYLRVRHAFKSPDPDDGDIRLVCFMLQSDTSPGSDGIKGAETSLCLEAICSVFLKCGTTCVCNNIRFLLISYQKVLRFLFFFYLKISV